MKKKQGLFILAGLLMTAGFFGKALAAEMEYSDPAKQARWEASQQKRAEKTEIRRNRFNRWIDGSLEKLKPNPDAHRGNDTAVGTISNIEVGGETK